MAVSVYTKTGAKATTAVTLNKEIFAHAVESTQLLKTAYEVQLGNLRLGNATTKSRGEVRGGGRKPWKQKGTGRARAGTIRSPLWRGGAITFGPTGTQNYNRKISTSSKQKAIKQALSLKNAAGAVSIIEALDCKDGKVKNTVAVLNKVAATGRILLVVENKDAMTVRATNNIPNVKVLEARYLNVVDVVNADTIIVEKKALDVLDAWLGGKK